MKTQEIKPLIRTRRFEMRIPKESGETWKPFYDELDPLWRVATEVVNFTVQRLLVLDHERDDGSGKLPRFDAKHQQVIYHEARTRWPDVHTRSLSYMIRDAVKKWKAKRFDILRMRASTPMNMRYPQPVALGDRVNFQRIREGKYGVAFNLTSQRIGGKRYKFELVAKWTDLETLQRIEAGTYELGACRLLKDHANKLYIEIGYSFCPPQMKTPLDQEREFVVKCGEPPKMLECNWPSCEESWLIPGTQIMQAVAHAERIRTRIRQDMKREMRLPKKKRLRREAAIQRVCDKLDRTKKTCVQQWAAGIVRKALQTRCGTIRVVRGATAPDFAWSLFDTALQSCAAKYEGLKVITPKQAKDGPARKGRNASRRAVAGPANRRR